jgi:hypothetical protein
LRLTCEFLVSSVAFKLNVLCRYITQLEQQQAQQQQQQQQQQEPPPLHWMKMASIEKGGGYGSNSGYGSHNTSPSKMQHDRPPRPSTSVATPRPSTSLALYAVPEVGGCTSWPVACESAWFSTLETTN